jgi:hypothetical protein
MIKQYVNLPPDAPRAHGARVGLSAEAASLAEPDVGFTEWWVEPSGADNVDARYLARVARARARHPERRNLRGRFTNTLILPHVGGDRYKVRCSKRGDRSSPLEVEEIETWRKIYYTVHYMNAACLTIFNNVKTKLLAAFEEAFIELKEEAVLRTLRDEPKTRSSNALEHLYRRRPGLANRPFHLRIVVLNDIYDVEDGEYTQTGVAAKVTVIATDQPLTDLTATHWRRRARARIEPAGRWMGIRAFASKTGERSITVDLGGHPQLSKAIDDGNTLAIEVATRERGHYLGHSLGNFCCVRINETGTQAEIEQTILQTFTHEIGHGFQQAVRRERTYDASGVANGWENNPRWHDDAFGGQGPHCSTNAKLAADPDTTSGQTYVHDTGTMCTMFFRDDPAVDADGKFCDTCKPRLRRVNLGERRMREKGWNWF